MYSTQEQGKSKPRPPPGCETAGEIIDHLKAVEERRRLHSETVPPPARIFAAADTYSTAAAKLFLEVAMRTALGVERILMQHSAGTAEVPPRALEMISFQAEAHRRTMRDAYLTAALEMLKMISGDFEPEPWNDGEEPPAPESSKLNQEEERICELYAQLTEAPCERDRR